MAGGSIAGRHGKGLITSHIGSIGSTGRQVCRAAASGKGVRTTRGHEELADLTLCHSQVTPVSLELHYWSRRQVGTPPGIWVVGIIEAVAEEMYGKQQQDEAVWSC